MFTDNITLGIPYTTREVNFKSLVSGTDSIKACTLIYCVVAATGIIFTRLRCTTFWWWKRSHVMFAVTDQAINSSRTRWYTIELRVSVLYNITYSDRRLITLWVSYILVMRLRAIASKCYGILPNNVLPLCYRRSNMVASRYYVLRFSKRRVTLWYTYVSECHVY